MAVYIGTVCIWLESIFPGAVHKPLVDPIVLLNWRDLLEFQDTIIIIIMLVIAFSVYQLRSSWRFSLSNLPSRTMCPPDSSFMKLTCRPIRVVAILSRYFSNSSNERPEYEKYSVGITRYLESPFYLT